MRLLKHHKTRLDNKGSVLVSLIITMVVLAALGAAMVSLTSTSMFGQVGANSSARAYFLAESGFRYAESKYLAASGETARDAELENLHKASAFTLLNNAGNFDLQIYPYFVKVDPAVTAGTSTGQIKTRVVGGDISLSSGRLKIGTKTGNIYDYNGVEYDEAADGKIFVTFKNVTPQPFPYFPLNTDVLPVAISISSSQSINEGDALLLQKDSAITFPQHNGTFQARNSIDNKYYIYAYKEKVSDSVNDRLQGITDPKVSPMSPLTVAAGSDVILQKFVKLHSTGIFGQGSVEGAASRKVVYHVPLPSATEERKEFKETFENLTNWETSTLGTFAVQDIDGSALRVSRTGSLGGTLTGSRIEFDSSTTNIDLAAAHLYGDPNFLSYDAQVKVGFCSPPICSDPLGGYYIQPIPKYFAAGLLFRLDNDDNSYGLSFLRGDNTDIAVFEDIDKNIVPLDRKPLIILWQGTNFGNNRKWLAYKDLSLFFKDNMELGINGWTASGLWHQSTGRSISSSHSWYYGMESTGNYDTGVANSGFLITPSINLTQASSAKVSIRSWYETQPNNNFLDTKHIDISKDNGTTWQNLYQLKFDINPMNTWELIELNLPSAYVGQTIKIRFRFNTGGDSNNNFEGWYIDDVRVFGEITTTAINVAAIVVRVKEAASVTFTNGTHGSSSTPIQNLDTIVGQNSGATGIVAGSPILSSELWASGNAAGTLILKNTSAPFFNNEQIKVIGSTAEAKVSEYLERDNFIKAYYGNTSGYGTSDNNPLNDEKKANLRGNVHWPPDEFVEWSADTDYFTLVQWDAVNIEVTTAKLLESLNEPNAIIRDNTPSLTSPPSGPLQKPEIGLHTFGKGSTNVFFDDFAVQADVGSSGNIGFVRTIQQ